MKLPLPLFIGLPIVFILQAVTNSDLSTKVSLISQRVVQLEQKVAKMEAYYDINAGTNVPMMSNERAVFEELIKLKKKVKECCGASDDWN